MNPYTQSLLVELDDSELAEWVARWDELESLVVEVYCTKRVGGQQAERYPRLRRQLREEYPRWQKRLAPYWRGLKAGGEVVEQDPFRALFAPERASAFSEDWRAMQTLPAAREALNSYLLERLKDE